MSSPEAHLEVAHEHQVRYEALGGQRPLSAGDIIRQKKERMEESIAVENHALLAIAGFLAQMHICDHGVRGWCPACHRELKNLAESVGS